MRNIQSVGYSSAKYSVSRDVPVLNIQSVGILQNKYSVSRDISVLKHVSFTYPCFCPSNFIRILWNLGEKEGNKEKEGKKERGIEEKGGQKEGGREVRNEGR